ncbi:MAG TPA: PilZ domain-containing protein [Candidatus Acidoferrales bacterium]
MTTGNTSAAGLDRREDFRAHFFAEVEYEWSGNQLRARVLNLSLGGLLLETREPLPMRAQFMVRLHLPEGAPMEMVCVVKRHIPGVGMGVEYADVRPSDHIRLRRLVDSLPH